MGVTATAILFGSPSPAEIAAIIEHNGGGPVSVSASATEGNMRIVFSDPVDGDRRMLWYIEPGFDRDHGHVYDGERTICSIGSNESGISILYALASRFGGFVRDADFNEFTAVAASDAIYQMTPSQTLRVDLENAVGRDLAAKLTSVVNDPDKLQALIAAFERYQDNTAELPIPWPR